MIKFNYKRQRLGEERLNEESTIRRLRSRMREEYQQSAGGEEKVLLPYWWNEEIEKLRKMCNRRRKEATRQHETRTTESDHNTNREGQ